MPPEIGLPSNAKKEPSENKKTFEQLIPRADEQVSCLGLRSDSIAQMGVTSLHNAPSIRTPQMFNYRKKGVFQESNFHIRPPFHPSPLLLGPRS